MFFTVQFHHRYIFQCGTVERIRSQYQQDIWKWNRLPEEIT